MHGTCLGVEHGTEQLRPCPNSRHPGHVCELVLGLHRLEHLCKSSPDRGPLPRRHRGLLREPAGLDNLRHQDPDLLHNSVTEANSNSIGWLDGAGDDRGSDRRVGCGLAVVLVAGEVVEVEELGVVLGSARGVKGGQGACRL